MERVSVPPGHSSVPITEKYYAALVRARQQQLEADVRRSWSLESELGFSETAFLSEGTPKGLTRTRLRTEVFLGNCSTAITHVQRSPARVAQANLRKKSRFTKYAVA
jgi:hypothetical protein